MAYEVTIGTDNNIGVTLSQVGQQGSKGADWEGAWVTSTAYAVDDVVKNNGTVYICILAHTADAASEPGVGGSTATYWEVFAEGGADGTDGDGWTGGSYDAGTGVVTFTSTDALGFTTGDLRGTDGTDGDGWTGGSYDAGTGVVTFTSTDSLGFATDDLRGTDGTGFTGGSYNASTGVVTFTSDDGLGFATDDLRGIDWQGSWVTATSYDANDTVENNGSSYICILTHTSASTNEPGVGVDTATYWELLAQKGADGAGTGTVTSVDVAGGTGLTSSGGPVTSSGTITVDLDAATIASLDLADAAQQPPVEGPFVDGDKTKLNDIEASATADQTAGEIKTAYESNTNTNAFTDSEQTKLTGIETNADVTDTANVTAAGALMDSEVTNLAAVKAFDATDYATAAQGGLADTATQSGDNISTLTNDAGYTTNAGDITGVTAGTGLSGGGASGGVTLSIDSTVATLTGTQTLTNKTFTGFTETVYNLTGTDIDPANGTIQHKTLTANTTFTESLTDGQSVMLRLAAGATYTVTWFTVTWVGGSAPTLTADDVLVFWQEGATVYGNYLGSVV